MRINGRQMAAVAVAVCLTTVTACSGDSPKSSTSPAQPSGRTSTSTSAHADAGDVSVKVPNDVAARRNVTVSSCGGSKTRWQATGRATNSSAKSVTYLVTVFFTSSRATVLAQSSTKVAVPAHGSALWKTAATFATKNDARCVLRGVAPVA